MAVPLSACEKLLLSISVLGVSLLYGGAPLAVALPGGALIWLLGRGGTRFFTGLAKLQAILLTLFPVYIAILQVSYWRAGQQGVDFGIFSQLIYQVARNDRFMTSLISFEWQNFITHHFSPYLIVLGCVAKLGIPSEVTLVAAHVVAVALLILGLRNVWMLGGSSAQTLVLTTLALLLPGVRRALGWETHDEILALPFIVWSLVAHLRGRYVLKLALLFPPLLFKETFGLVMFVTALVYAMSAGSGLSREEKLPKRLALLVALFGFIFFVLVTQVFPRWLWWPTFDPTARLSSWEELLDGDLSRLRLRWVATVFAPMIPFVVLHTRRSLRVSAVLIAPALYNIGAILVSNFPSMMEPRNYYSVTPSIIAFLAISLPVARHPRFAIATLCAAGLTLLSGGTVRSSKIVRAGFSDPSAYDELRMFVPQQSRVIADDYTASVLADNSYVMRAFHAQEGKPSFDYIVVQRAHPEFLPDALRERASVCHETPRYLILCAKR